MKKLVSIVIACVSYSYASAQFNNIPLLQPDGEPAKNYVWQAPDSELRTTNCAVDTVYYTAAKTTTQKIKILYKDGTYASSYGQRFSCGQSIDIIGFKWYGYSHDPSGLTNPIINVDCSIYNVSGGLPTGAPLATTTIVVDSNSANAERNITFATPVTVTSSYAVVVTNSQPEYLYVLSNDENVMDGAGEGLSFCYYEPGSDWFKNLTLWGLGDFDLLFHPIVDYTINTDFDMPAGNQACVGDAITFTNNSSWVLYSKFYSSAVQSGGSPSWHWDYGDGNTDNYQEHGTNMYASSGTYNITLSDTIFGWTMMCEESLTQTIDVYDIPAAPVSIPPAAVCEGTLAPDLTATGTGGTLTWYSNAGLTNVMGTGTPFASGLTGPAPSVNVYVTETVNGCESPSTTVAVSFLTNASPTFTPVNTGGASYDFTGAPVATSYAWDFGDGVGTSIIQTPSYTYATGGTYTVCLDVIYSNGCVNQYCDVVTIVGQAEYGLSKLVDVYPNPTEDGFYIESDQLEHTDLIVYDVIGNIVLSVQLNEAQRTYIDTKELSAGTYILAIRTMQGLATKKLIVNK